MNKLNEILNSSNLGWIQGKFLANYSNSDLSTKEEEAEKRDWSAVGNDTGYPEELKIIFEYEGSIIAILKKVMTPELFTEENVIVENGERLSLGQLMGCNIVMIFEDHNLGDQRPCYGTFTASIYEDEINSHLDKIMNLNS